MAKTTSSTRGVGFIGLLTIVFITLKVLGLISWSWWWVFSPIWLAVLGTIIALLSLVIGLWLYERWDRR